MRYLLVIALFLWSAHARAAPPAQPCPSFTMAWAQQWGTGTIQSASYDQDAQVLYVIPFSQVAHAYAHVPIGVQQGFSRTNNPEAYYQQSVAPVYPEMLLAESTNCPILLETGGYLYTRDPRGEPQYHSALYLQSNAPLLLQNGGALWID
jgi:hypothetical protein